MWFIHYNNSIYVNETLSSRQLWVAFSLMNNFSEGATPSYAGFFIFLLSGLCIYYFQVCLTYVHIFVFQAWRDMLLELLVQLTELCQYHQVWKDPNTEISVRLRFHCRSINIWYLDLDDTSYLASGASVDFFYFSAELHSFIYCWWVVKDGCIIIKLLIF